MRRTGRERGYVMLAVLLAVAVAAIAASTLFGLAWAVDSTAAADDRYERGVWSARTAITAAADQLVWGGLPDLWRGADEVVDESRTSRGQLTTRVRRVEDATGTNRFEISVESEDGPIHSGRRRSVTVSTLRLPLGLTVSGDLRVGASLVLDGCGAYVGRDVHGRQNVSTPGNAEGRPADHARTRDWPTAGVHAGGHIYDGAGDVHSSSGATYPDDTDACTGQDLAQLSTPAWPMDSNGIAVLQAHAVQVLHPDAAARVSLPDLDECQVGPPQPPQTGAVVVLEPSNGVVQIEGWRDMTPGAPQLTVLVLGDAVLVPPANPAASDGVALQGALLVTGTLRVTSPTVVAGALAAGEILVESPTTIVVTSDWSSAPPPAAWIALPLPSSEEGR